VRVIRLSAYVRQPDRCPHAWTLRYWVNGKQVEKSFRDKKHPNTGRVDYGSGKKLVQDWQLKLTVDKRSGDVTIADHGKTGRQNFGEACEQFVARMRVNGNTRILYVRAYRTYVQPLFGGKTLAQVARDRDGVTELLTMTMHHLSNSPRQQTRLLIVGTCDEAVKAGRLARHNLADIELADHGPKNLLDREALVCLGPLFAAHRRTVRNLERSKSSDPRA
jgi:hypothetical protein